MTMCSAVMQRNAIVAAIECATGTVNAPRNSGMSRLANAGSPIHPRAREASVTPSWVAER